MEEFIMSVAEQISRIQQDRNIIRNKLITLGLANGTDTLDDLAEAIDEIENNGSISANVKEGETYTIPPGFHDGTGTVSGVAGGGNYKLQSKSVTPTKKTQVITPDEGNYGLSDVNVAPIPDAYQDVTAVTAAAGDVLAGKVIVDSNGTITAGTMPNNGSVVHELATDDFAEDPLGFTIPAGYHDGTGRVFVTKGTFKDVTPMKVPQECDTTLFSFTVLPIPDEYQDVTEVNAVAEDVLSGKKIVDSAGNVVEGNIPVYDGKGRVELKVNNAGLFLYKGYYNDYTSVNVLVEDDLELTPTKEVQEFGLPHDTASFEIDPGFYQYVKVNPIPDKYQDVTEVNAIAAEILADRKIVAKDGSVVIGTMKNNGIQELALNLKDYPKGWVELEGYYAPGSKVGVEEQDLGTITPEKRQIIKETDFAHVIVEAIPDKYQDVTAVDATAAEVLSGKKIVNKAGEVVTGTMANNGSVTASIDGITVTSVEVPAGYTAGGTISLTSDIEYQLSLI
jgi:hypothetical protein